MHGFWVKQMLHTNAVYILLRLRNVHLLNCMCVCVCLGLDIKGGMVAPDTTLYTTVEEHAAYYFNTHSRELLVQVKLISLHFLTQTHTLINESAF